MKTPPCPVKPTLGRCVVLLAKPDKATKGGILLPDNARKEFATEKGTIVHPGEIKVTKDTVNLPHIVYGATAYFAFHSGVRIKIGDDEFVVLDHDMIVATSEE